MTEQEFSNLTNLIDAAQCYLAPAPEGADVQGAARPYLVKINGSADLIEEVEELCSKHGPQRAAWRLLGEAKALLPS